MFDDQERPELQEVGIRDKLNTEAGKLEWHELEKFFARGVVIVVVDSLDLIEVGAAMAEDDAAKIAAWKQQNLIGPPKDAEVLVWLESKPLFWTVVVAPWVVIQKIATS